MNVYPGYVTVYHQIHFYLYKYNVYDENSSWYWSLRNTSTSFEVIWDIVSAYEDIVIT